MPYDILPIMLNGANPSMRASTLLGLNADKSIAAVNSDANMFNPTNITLETPVKIKMAIKPKTLMAPRISTINTGYFQIRSRGFPV